MSKKLLIVVALIALLGLQFADCASAMTQDQQCLRQSRKLASERPRQQIPQSFATVEARSEDPEEVSAFKSSG
jgi:hypothetical protein